MPLLGALLAAVSLFGYVTVDEGLASTSLQQVQGFVDNVWEEGEETGKEEMLAQRSEREQAQIGHEEVELERASAPEGANATETASGGEAEEGGETS